MCLFSCAGEMGWGWGMQHGQWGMMQGWPGMGMTQPPPPPPPPDGEDAKVRLLLVIHQGGEMLMYGPWYGSQYMARSHLATFLNLD